MSVGKSVQVIFSKQKAEIKLSNASQNCFSYFGILEQGATQETVYSRALNIHNIHIRLSHKRTHNIFI